MLKQFLKTYELTTEVLSLISSTKSYCYIVSPYIKIWPQLDRVLNDASRAGIFLTFVIREKDEKDKTDNVKQVISTLNGKYGFEVVTVKDIHVKLFLNEEKCILSTMNLYDASQKKNIELGYLVRNPESVKKEIIEQYILSDASIKIFPGKFEQKRKEVLKEVEKSYGILSQKGYCVDCKKRIEGDFNPYSPRYIRCKDCYYENDDEKIKYCHFCGKSHKSVQDKPFHYDCTQILKEHRYKTKHY